jgi:hypothetical protein
MLIGGVLVAFALLPAAGPEMLQTDAPDYSAPACVEAAGPPPGTDAVDGPPYKAVWGVLDGKLFPDGLKMSPNGVTFHPVVSLDLDFNLWLWRGAGIYLFGTSRFWGREDGDQPIIMGPKPNWQSMFNVSKREYDLNAGAAWNYWGPLEARGYAYSMNNLNRGFSLSESWGYNDGFGLENRVYLSSEYARLGREGFNISRAAFLSVGYYPTKRMTGLDGQFFAPGPFARAYLIADIPWVPCYLFADLQLIGKSNWQPKLLQTDAGLAIVPLPKFPLFEVRLGSEVVADFLAQRSFALPYVSLRLNY